MQSLWTVENLISLLSLLRSKSQTVNYTTDVEHVLVCVLKTVFFVWSIKLCGPKVWNKMMIMMLKSVLWFTALISSSWSSVIIFMILSCFACFADHAEFVFLASFICEGLLKMYGLGLQLYFQSSFNIFDCVVSNRRSVCSFDSISV